MSNGSLTCEIQWIWKEYMLASAYMSVGASRRESRKQMAQSLLDLASREDCDMHNLEQLSEYLATADSKDR